jgi:sec-independent protein translocase protein TatA
MHFNAVELIIVLLIVLVLFGGGRVGHLGGELGAGIREFRKGLQGEEPTQKPKEITGPENANPPAKNDSVAQ